MHPSHEAGMDVAGRVGHDEIGKLAIDVGQFARRLRQRRAKLLANVRWNRLPHRTGADLGDVVDHVIEHAMTLRADGLPILRIERHVRLRGDFHIRRNDAHAACSRACAARRSSIAANAENTFCICGDL